MKSEQTRRMARLMQDNAEMCCAAWARVFGVRPDAANAAAARLNEIALRSHAVLHPALGAVEIREAWEQVLEMMEQMGRHTGGMKMLAITLECGAAMLQSVTLRQRADAEEAN